MPYRRVWSAAFDKNVRIASASPSPTPNPNAMKFTLDSNVPADLEASAFGQELLAIPGVASIFGVVDFVTVTREGDAAWESIVDAVVAAAAKL
ncbi:MAG: NifU N-terminal domain-containing protein [Acidimicrobiales bacterium]|nr:NifU N-terminal domain-containing protein [Acidimicrobiales bacterium]